ncbi:hypothetical protein CKF54_04110 [Psittacicella hinzii]|uniref:Uncharacterized protein n=1 Tax=Psittacicella hinzii TaxID=2028575 RepID=A0A3A1Y9R6_9GAMM|nr:hypothetical protein [Psittacicella hinzii]RIY32884.1 hypothetical protein CKF54_04110 [Psittacicella hinzii]
MKSQIDQLEHAYEQIQQATQQQYHELCQQYFQATQRFTQLANKVNLKVPPVNQDKDNLLQELTQTERQFAQHQQEIVQRASNLESSPATNTKVRELQTLLSQYHLPNDNPEKLIATLKQHKLIRKRTFITAGIIIILGFFLAFMLSALLF